MVAGARERDVGVVGTRVKHETAGLRTGADVLLHQDQGGCKLHTGKEYSCALKEPGCLKLNGKRRMVQFTQARSYATALAFSAVT
jgi:hypothetical protein